MGFLQSHNFCVTLITLANILTNIEAKISLANVFLNSHDFCGHDKTFEVNPTKGYIVMPDIGPHVRTTSFRDCEVTFHSVRHSGRLCVSQEGKLGEIQDNNAQLKIYDGESDNTDNVVTMGYGPAGQWTEREYCTNSPYLYIYLERIDKTKQTDISKVHLTFKVQDIQSKDRKLYLEENFCDNSYQLEDSQVEIVNRLPYSSPVPSRNVKHLCLLEVNRKANDSRSTCFVYMPSETLQCGKGWDLHFSSQKALDSSKFIRSLKCEDAEAKKTHVWCAGNTTNSLTLILARNNVGLTSNSTEEAPGMFRIFVADYTGSPESFLMDVESQIAAQNSVSTSEGLAVHWIALIVVAVLVFIAGIYFVVYTFRNRYSKVLNPKNDDHDDDRET